MCEERREFYWGDISSITTGRCLAPDGSEAFKDTLLFITKAEFTTYAELKEMCFHYLVGQFPYMRPEIIDSAILEFIELNRYNRTFEVLAYDLPRYVSSRTGINMPEKFMIKPM